MSSFKDKLTAYKAKKLTKTSVCTIQTQKKMSGEINGLLMNLDWLNDEDRCVVMNEYNIGYIKSKDKEKYHIGIICDILQHE